MEGSSNRRSTSLDGADRSARFDDPIGMPGVTGSGGNGHEGPDYVDEWMERKLEPDLIQLVRKCCTSFMRWDLLRRLDSRRDAATVGELAAALGIGDETVASELEQLVSMGLVARDLCDSRSAYLIARDSPGWSCLEQALRAYEEDHEFRFAVVYSIVRASHHGTVFD